MTKREPDGETADPPSGRSRRWVRWLGIAAAAEVAAVAMVAAASFGVLGVWPQQQADRLRHERRPERRETHSRRLWPGRRSRVVFRNVKTEFAPRQVGLAVSGL